jgi:hypothetical protein
MAKLRTGLKIKHGKLRCRLIERGADAEGSVSEREDDKKSVSLGSKMASKGASYYVGGFASEHAYLKQNGPELGNTNSGKLFNRSFIRRYENTYSNLLAECSTADISDCSM